MILKSCQLQDISLQKLYGGGGCTTSKHDKKEKKLKELDRFQTQNFKSTQSNQLLTKENYITQTNQPQDSIIRMYKFGENIHSEFQKKYDKYIDDKKIQKDIQLKTQVFEMHQMFTKCLYNFKPLIAQNSEGYRIMIFHILQVYQQYMLTGLVNTDQFIQKDIKEHIKEIEYFIQYLKLKVKTQPCLDLVFLSEFYLDINRNRVGLDTASLTGYEKLADFMIDAVVFSLKAVIAFQTGAIFELIPDIVEFALKVCKEFCDIREYQSNQFVKVDGIQIKNMKFLFLFNLYKTKIDKFKGEFLRLPAEKEIEFYIEQYLIYKEKKLSDQYMLYILAQINFLFDVVLFEKSSKSDFEGIKNVADLMHNFVDILLQRSNDKEKLKEQQSYYSFAVKNTTFRFLANSILIKYRIILGKIPFKQEEQQQITIHLIHSLLSEKDDRVKILFKKDQKLIDIAKQVIIDDQLSQDVINYAIQRIHSMQEYHLESVQEKIRNKSDIEKKLSIQQEYDEIQQKKLELEKIKVMEECLQNKQIEKLLYLPINLYLFTRLVAEIQDNSKRDIIDQITDQISVQEYFFSQQFRREAIAFIDDQKIQSKIHSREELITMIISNYFTYFQTMAIHMFCNLQKKNFLQVRLFLIRNIFSLSENVQAILNDEQKEDLKQKILFYENSNIIIRFQSLENESINLDYCNLSEAYLKGSNLNFIYANTKNANFHSIQLKYNSKNTFSYKSVVIGESNTIYALSLTGYLNEFRIYKGDFNIVRSQSISQEPLYDLCMCNGNLILHSDYNLIQVNKRTFRNENQKQFSEGIKYICVSTYNQILVLTGTSSCYYGSFEFGFNLIKNVKGNKAMFSSTGNYLLLANTENKLEIRKVSDNFNNVTSLFFKAEQKIVATFSSDDTYLIVAQQNKLKVLKQSQNQFVLSEQFEIDNQGTSDIVSLAFSNNDQYLVISSSSSSQIREFIQPISSSKSQSHSLAVSQMNTSKPIEKNEFIIKIMNFIAINQTLQFTNDSQYLLAFNQFQLSLFDSSFELLNLKQQNPLNEIKAFAISPDEQNIALYSLDDSCKFFNTSQNYQLQDQFNNNTLITTSIAFSSDGLYFAVCFADKICYIRNAKNFFKNKCEIPIELNSKCILDFYKKKNREYLIIVSDLRYYILDVLNDFQILINHPLINSAAAIAKNGLLLAYCVEDSLTVFDLFDKNKIIIKESNYTDSNKLIVFSGDSKYFAQSFEQTKCQIWLLEKQQKKTLTCHDQQISSIAFSGDGQYFATSSIDFTCKLWSVSTDFDLLETIDCSNSYVTYLTFYPHRNILVACDKDFSFQLWDIEKMYISINKNKQNQGDYKSSQFSPDNKYLAIGTSEGYCKIWNTKNYKSHYKIKAHSKSINQVIFSSNGKYLITSSDDKTCRVIEIQKNNFKLTNYVIYHFGPIIQFSISQDCKYLVTSSTDKKCNVWNIQEGFKLQSTLKDSNNKVISIVSLSADSSHLACCTEKDNVLNIYNLSDLKLIYKKQFNFTIVSIIYSSDGNYLIICTLHGNEILSKFNYQTLFIQENDQILYKSLTLSQDSNYIAAVHEFDDQNECSLIKIDQGFKSVQKILHISEYLNRVSISMDADDLAVMSDRDQFKILNKYSRIQHVKQIKCNRRAIYSICFSKDGRYLVTSTSEDICEVWDSQDQYRKIKEARISHNRQNFSQRNSSSEEVDLLLSNIQKNQIILDLNAENQLNKQFANGEQFDSNSHIFAVAFSYDDMYLATASSDKTCKVWQVENQFYLYKTLSGHSSSVSSVSFSPDGQYLITGSKDSSFKIWSLLNDFELVQTIQNSFNQNYPISSVAFSSYGKYFATGSYDNTCKIWSTQNEFKLFQQLEGHLSHVYCIAFSDNDQFFASGSSDATCKIWLIGDKFKLIKNIEFHKSGIYALTFSKQSKYLATGSYDGTCGIWNAQSQFQLISLINNVQSGIYSLAFSNDGEQLIMGNQISGTHMQTTLKAQNKLQIVQIQQDYNSIYLL
ncbi:hypothetical protein ABPG74_020909 [Tetrahymena malaccensis]